MLTAVYTSKISGIVHTTAASRLYSTRYSSHVAVGTAATSQSAFEQSNLDWRRLDRECRHSHLVASLGRDSSFCFSASFLFCLTVTFLLCLGHILHEEQAAVKPASSEQLRACAVWRSDVSIRMYARVYIRT